MEGPEVFKARKCFCSQASKDKVVQELNHKIWHAPYRPWIPVDWGIALLKKGGWAFHAEVSLLFPKIAKQFDQPAICRLSEVVLTSQRVLPIFSQEHGPLTDTFKIRYFSILHKD